MSVNFAAKLGYWHQRADERQGNLPKGNQELLVVRNKVGRPRGKLGESKSMECDIKARQPFILVIPYTWRGMMVVIG